MADVRFREQIDLTYKRLLAQGRGSTSARTAALTREAKRLFLAGTLCAPLYVMADCGNDQGSG